MQGSDWVWKTSLSKIIPISIVSVYTEDVRMKDSILVCKDSVTFLPFSKKFAKQ